MKSVVRKERRPDWYHQWSPASVHRVRELWNIGTQTGAICHQIKCEFGIECTAATVYRLRSYYGGFDDRKLPETPPEVVQFMRELWDRGNTQAQIADAATARFEHTYSRNAVAMIGRRHRFSRRKPTVDPWEVYVMSSTGRSLIVMSRDTGLSTSELSRIKRRLQRSGFDVGEPPPPKKTRIFAPVPPPIVVEQKIPHRQVGRNGKPFSMLQGAVAGVGRETSAIR